MRQPIQFANLLLILFFALLSLPFYAQNQTSIQLNGSKMRVPIDVPMGENEVLVHGLVPGNIYTVKASRAAEGQLAVLELAPSKSTANTAVNMQVEGVKKQKLRFVAASDRAVFQIKAQSASAVTTVPLYLTVFCETCPDDVKGSMAESMANLQVTPNVSPQNLISNTLIGGDCFSVTNITSSGNAQARGTFSNGGTNIGLAEGMVLSTGRINILPGPNNAEGANGGFGNDGSDSDLSNLVDGDLLDVNRIEFDFTPTANTVQFDFVFGSEEYCEYVGTEFNDAFGFFISGPGIAGVQNLAVIPGSGGVPVTTNNVNHIANSVYYVNNSSNFLECDFLPPNHLQECQLDGFTTPLTAIATVIPCSTYHIKLVIADVTDEFWDSAVFLRANSFNAGGTAQVTPAYNTNLSSAVEGCSQGAIRFARSNNDMSQPVVVNFVVSPASTATAGVDYFPLESPVIIPVGQMDIIEPVNVFTDGLLEGQENIIILVDNACQCQTSQVEFLINDTISFNASVRQDTVICEGFSASLSALTDIPLDDLSYQWSNGDSTQNITVSPLVSTIYTVTVTNGCGGAATASATVEVIPIFKNSITATICSGGSYEINGVVYTEATTVIDTSYEQFICGIITTYNILVSDPITGSETIEFCPGEYVAIGGLQYNESGTVIDTFTLAGGCDSIVTYTLVRLPEVSGADTIPFCPGDAVEIAGVLYTQPGTVEEVLTAASGCDSLVTHTLVLLTQPTRAETILFCPGTSIVVAGITIAFPGTLTVTSPATVGCDTIVQYAFDYLPVPTRSETIGFCPGETITLGGNAYTQPGTVEVVAPAATGCDTVVTYTLEYLVPAPSTVSAKCPFGVSINVPSGATQAVVTYTEPTATSDCPCPGMTIDRTAGPASGSVFSLGQTEVCYTATDACGNTQSCCFKVTVEEENPCDEKVIGCMKYELLTITQDQFKNKTYRVRVTNFCSTPLIYTAIQTPSGLVAMAPANNAVYTAPSGNEYLVRNPNFSPFYSVRYRSIGGGIANGESDILRYTLPAQAEVLFINITSRLSIQTFYEAHLNTFYCPVGVTPLDQRSEDLNEGLMPEAASDVFVFPNPTDGTLHVDLAVWEGQSVQMQIFNSQGQRVWQNAAVAALSLQNIDLPRGIADGLYFLEVATDAGEKEVVKFVVQH
jgi:hypothetical protein